MQTFDTFSAMHRAECLMQEFMVEQGLVTRTRRAFDRALCALPITQHERIWQIYLVSPPWSLTSLILGMSALGNLHEGDTAV